MVTYNELEAALKEAEQEVIGLDQQVYRLRDQNKDLEKQVGELEDELDELRAAKPQTLYAEQVHEIADRLKGLSLAQLQQIETLYL